MNCIDCPNHEVIPDPDPHDYFNSDDVAVICKLCPNDMRNLSSLYVAPRQQFKLITVACRPCATRDESPTPDWCPLGLDKIENKDAN